MDFEAYLDALASAEPAPGGGSAATLVGAMGAALCAMVARITAGGAKHAAVHAQARSLAVEADALRAAFLALRPRDEAAFRAVVHAQALPRRNDDERSRRTAALQDALVYAAEVPLEAAARSADVFALAARTAALGNANLASDVACALDFARAAFEASAANVRVNHRYIRDEATIAVQSAHLTALAAHAAEHEREVRARLAA